MSSKDLNALLNESGVSSTGWQGALAALGMKVAVALAPQAMVLLERLLKAGAGAALSRLDKALAPADTPDYALAIVRGIERMHGPGGKFDEQMTGPARAEMARDAIQQWMRNKGAEPDMAMLNSVVEGAVARLKVEQEKQGSELAKEH